MEKWIQGAVDLWLIGYNKFKWDIYMYVNIN